MINIICAYICAWRRRISLSRAAELLDVSTFDILRLIKEQEHTGPTEEELKESRKTAKSLKIQKSLTYQSRRMDMIKGSFIVK